MNKIATRIKELRENANMSQTTFANQLNVSQDTVSLWERGKSLPSTEYVVIICKKFDVSADYLLGLIE